MASKLKQHQGARALGLRGLVASVPTCLEAVLGVSGMELAHVGTRNHGWSPRHGQ